VSDRLALSVAEAANELGCSERTVRSMVSRNEIPHVRLGRRVVLPTHLLRQWLEDRVLPSPEGNGERRRVTREGDHAKEVAGGTGTRKPRPQR
jgi:excisionase family DNA binding protein